MSKYFGRKARVLVKQKGVADLVFPLPGPGDATGTTPVQPHNDFFSALSDALHIKFHVEKDLLGQPNRLDLSVYNLAPRTRGQMQAAGGYVVLQAGYEADGNNLPTLFEGNARTIDHQSQGPNWVTRIQCGDGETSYQYARINGSWGPGTAKGTVAADLAETIRAADADRIKIDLFLDRVALVSSSPNAISFNPPAFFSGYATSGNAFEELKSLLGGRYDLLIQDGELVALTARQTLNSTGLLLDAAHGLIGSPEHCAPIPGSPFSLLKATSLLNARLNPATQVRIESVDKSVTGNYRVQKVTHTGDLAGNDWQSELELLPLQ